MKYTWMESPVGRLLLAGDEAGLRSVSFLNSNRADVVREDWVADSVALRDVERQLRDYFAGELREFDLELAPTGTEFQLRVWRQLRAIPYGETISYGELAKRVGNAQASRAVGLANGCNPIAIIVPCHRVIGSDGSLTGFGGGLRNKEILLELESGQGRLLWRVTQFEVAPLEKRSWSLRVGMVNEKVKHRTRKSSGCGTLWGYVVWNGRRGRA
jgi:methylated-DNA-[protein]-cysteine S-methyltransferase